MDVNSFPCICTEERYIFSVDRKKPEQSELNFLKTSKVIDVIIKPQNLQLLFFSLNVKE